MGHPSSFLYGYGPKGQKSKQHVKSRHFKFTSRISASLNLFSYRFLGHENKMFSKFEEYRVGRIISKFDIVHLHVIHSYFIDYSILFKSIVKFGIPVVWTIHDQWIMTGRCAQPGICMAWKNGCNKCPDLGAYPPGFTDKAEKNFRLKRAAIAFLASNTRVRLVSCAYWLERELKSAGFVNSCTVTNSIDSEFQLALEIQNPQSSGINLFICRDLRDEKKIDWNLLGEISRIPGQKLTIMGDNPRITIPTADYIPSSTDRSFLASVYLSHKRLIFTSQVDYFPLTITEALACGLEVYAINSLAAQEFISHPKLVLFDSGHELLEELLKKQEHSLFCDTQNQLNTFDFSPRGMAEKYERIYNELMKEKLSK